MLSYLSKARSSALRRTDDCHWTWVVGNHTSSPHPTTFGFPSSDGGIGLVQTRSSIVKTTSGPKNKTSRSHNNPPSHQKKISKSKYLIVCKTTIFDCLQQKTTTTCSPNDPWSLVLIGSWIFKKEENPKDIAGFQELILLLENILQLVKRQISEPSTVCNPRRNNMYIVFGGRVNV